MEVEKRAIGKVMRRLIPFLIVCYFVAYLDRVNVGFAKLHMNQALGLSDAAFGLGAGLFFIGYFLFEVPSNIFLEKVGARVWIARIMITWGIVSAAFAFIPHGYQPAPAPRRMAYSTFCACCSAHRRSRLLSGHHFLSHALVSGGLPRPGHQLCSCWRFRFSSIIGSSDLLGLLLGRDGRGAGAVGNGSSSWRGLPSVLVGIGVSGLSDRFPAPGALAATG